MSSDECSLLCDFSLYNSVWVWPLFFCIVKCFPLSFVSNWLFSWGSRSAPFLEKSPLCFTLLLFAFVSLTSAFLCNPGITAHLPAAILRPIAHLGSLQSLYSSAKQYAATLLFIPHLLCLNTQDSLYWSPPRQPFTNCNKVFEGTPCLTVCFCILFYFFFNF